MAPASAQVGREEGDEGRRVDSAGLDDNNHDRGQASRVDKRLRPALSVPDTESDKNCIPWSASQHCDTIANVIDIYIPVQEKLVNNVSEKNEVIQCFSSVMKTTAVGETRENETTAPIPVAIIFFSFAVSAPGNKWRQNSYSLTPPQNAITAGAMMRLSYAQTTYTRYIYIFS